MAENAQRPGAGNTAKDKPKPFVFRLYDWYDRYDTWRERLDWLLALMKANTAATATAVTTTTAAVTVGTVAVVSPQTFERLIWSEPPAVVEAVPAPPAPPPPVVVAEAPPPPPPPPAQPVRVETNKWGDATIYPIEGRDTAGRRALFEVAVLPKDLTWQRKDSDHLSRAGTMLAHSDIVTDVLVEDFREGLRRSGTVMAVGVASQEGDVREEADRARRRAETAAAWLTEALPTTTGIWTLNLGQYKGSCAVGETDDTAWQRPVLMIGVREQERDVNLAEALGNAMSGKSNLPDRSCYSHFELARYR